MADTKTIYLVTIGVFLNGITSDAKSNTSYFHENRFVRHEMTENLEKLLHKIVQSQTQVATIVYITNYVYII